MVSSGRQAIAYILLILGIAIHSQAQTTPAKQPTATVSGKVTIKGKGVPGIAVMATEYNYRGVGERPSYRATTDASGNYRISNVPEGSYQIRPHAPAFALDEEQAFNPLNIAHGETVEDVNFSLVRGGVITGKITDSAGEPLIEHSVSLNLFDKQRTLVFQSHSHTDDRGVYRSFGLRAGKYKVSAGADGDRFAGPGRGGELYVQTYYPSVTDEDKATVIEVFEGSEVKDVDIVLATRGPNTFKVSGRIVDGVTGKALPNIIYGISQHFEGRTSSSSGSRTNADGEFKFENLSPGKYSVFVHTGPDSEVRADPLEFDVTDSDLSGLVLKAVKAASLSGVVVIEGMDEKSASTRLTEMFVSAHVSESVAYAEVDSIRHVPGAGGVIIKPNGSFKIGGLRAGTANISVSVIGRSSSQDIALIRVERAGVPQPDGVTIKEGEHVQGLRLVVRQLTGAIRGQVKIEGGELPRSSYLFVSIAQIDGTPEPSQRSEQVDSRGRFYIQGLAAGKYEVKVTSYGPGVFSIGSNESKQEVTIADNAVTEVVLTLKLKTTP